MRDVAWWSPPPPERQLVALEPHVDLEHVVLEDGAGRSRTKAVACAAGDAS